MLKEDGCVGCDELPRCKYEKNKLKKKFADISDADILMMIGMSLGEISLSELAENEKEPVDTSSLERINNDLSQSEWQKALSRALKILTPREMDVIILRYGLLDDRPLTLEEVGQKYSITRERVRQIEAKSLRKLNIKKIRGILEDSVS